MANQEQSKASSHNQNPLESEETEEVALHDMSAIDSLLDQIDATLEKNASAFVNSFVQKGGQ